MRTVSWRSLDSTKPVRGRAVPWSGYPDRPRPVPVFGARVCRIRGLARQHGRIGPRPSPWCVRAPGGYICGSSSPRRWPRHARRPRAASAPALLRTRACSASGPTPGAASPGSRRHRDRTCPVSRAWRHCSLAPREQDLRSSGRRAVGASAAQVSRPAGDRTLSDHRLSQSTFGPSMKRVRRLDVGGRS